mmetsp:Transcript_30458/g.87356  ORF Transcript_30458/g.87356 Transcript_30458/m.87356 type:complete len:192 (+) Transcript_30458:56-631(+)
MRGPVLFAISAVFSLHAERPGDVNIDVKMERTALMPQGAPDKVYKSGDWFLDSLQKDRIFGEFTGSWEFTVREAKKDAGGGWLDTLRDALRGLIPGEGAGDASGKPPTGRHALRALNNWLSLWQVQEFRFKDYFKTDITYLGKRVHVWILTYSCQVGSTADTKSKREADISLVMMDTFIHGVVIVMGEEKK